MLERCAPPCRRAKSIGTLVNTHANGDHTFGNQLVEGAEIIASRACAEEMEERPPEELAAMHARTGSSSARPAHSCTDDGQQVRLPTA